jgi:hypothetical protein
MNPAIAPQATDANTTAASRRTLMLRTERPWQVILEENAKLSILICT